MPLRDHFHPPLYPRHHWQSFLSSWATRIADLLIDRWLPPDFLAEEHIHSASRREIDVTSSVDSQVDDIPSPIIVPPPWTPPAPAHAMPAVFPDSFEVRVFSTMGGRTLVGAIELVSPGNKDRPDERRAFATKCASYLHQGVSLIIMDIVTSRRSNMHSETMRLMQAAAEMELSAEAQPYSVAYRPVLRQERAEIDLWTATFSIGQPLPTMPLRLTGDLFVPVDFEATYQEACRRRRLA